MNEWSVANPSIISLKSTVVKSGTSIAIRISFARLLSLIRLRSRILTNLSWLKERSTVAVPTGRVSKMRLIPRTDQETFILGWSGSGDDTKGWEGNERGWGHRVGGRAYMFLPPPPPLPPPAKNPVWNPDKASGYNIAWPSHFVLFFFCRCIFTKLQADNWCWFLSEDSLLGFQYQD